MTNKLCQQIVLALIPLQNNDNKLKLKYMQTSSSNLTSSISQISFRRFSSTSVASGLKRNLEHLDVKGSMILKKEKSYSAKRLPRVIIRTVQLFEVLLVLFPFSIPYKLYFTVLAA